LDLLSTTALRAARKTDGVKTAQKELNKFMRAARLQHKERAEQNLSTLNSKKLWDSIRGMTNMEAKRKPLVAQDESLKANALNQFYMRFESDKNMDCCDVLDNVGIVSGMASVVPTLY